MPGTSPIPNIQRTFTGAARREALYGSKWHPLPKLDRPDTTVPMAHALAVPFPEHVICHRRRPEEVNAIVLKFLKDIGY